MHAITVEPVDMAPKGGSIYASASSLVVKNSIFVDNIADVGSDIHIVGLDSPALLDISFSAISGLRNITAEGPLASLIIEEGILTQRPHFANPSQRDFRLKSRAGRFDATNSCTWVTDDLHSPGISAGHPDSDNSLEPAPNGQRINLGAYGNTAQASMDLWFIHGDATQTCTLNILDIIFIRNRLGQPVETCDQYRADVNRDGVIDFHDLLFVRNLLGKTCD